MRKRAIFALAGFFIALGLGLTGWIAFPTTADLELPPPLQAWSPEDPPVEPYAKDFARLASSFRPQTYRSFCGPASIATVLRSYGVKEADQTALFPSLGSKFKTFYSGIPLRDLASLAQHAGLQAEAVYADTLDVGGFRERLKAVLGQDGDYALVNYDRRILHQAGAGHISPVGAYDPDRDAFLILDEADYKYPFTWIPASLLYDAAHTSDGERFRGILLIHGYAPPN